MPRTAETASFKVHISPFLFFPLLPYENAQELIGNDTSLIIP